VAKTIFAGKNYFCQPGFLPWKKTVISTNQQKPANPVLVLTELSVVTLFQIKN